MVEHVVLTSRSLQLGTALCSNDCRPPEEHSFGLRAKTVVRPARKHRISAVAELASCKTLASTARSSSLLIAARGATGCEN